MAAPFPPAAALPLRQRRPSAMGAYEEKLVREMRGRRASWDAIGAALGRPTLDVRAQFDPEFAKTGYVMRPIRGGGPARNDDDGGLTPRRRPLPPKVPAVMLEKLELLLDGRAPVKLKALGEALGCSGDYARRLMDGLARSLPRGAYIAVTGDGYQIVRK